MSRTGFDYQQTQQEEIQKYPFVLWSSNLLRSGQQLATIVLISFLLLTRNTEVEAIITMEYPYRCQTRIRDNVHGNEITRVEDPHSTDVYQYILFRPRESATTPHIRQLLPSDMPRVNVRHQVTTKQRPTRAHRRQSSGVLGGSRLPDFGQWWMKMCCDERLFVQWWSKKK